MAEYDPRLEPQVTDQTGRVWPGVPGFGQPQQAQPPIKPKAIKLEIGKRPPKHAEYLDRKKQFEFYQASYDGGAPYRNAKDADGVSVLAAHDTESPNNFKRRLAATTYRNYCKPIVDKFFAFVYGAGVQRPTEDAFDAWAEDVDGQGTSYKEFAEHATRQAMILGRWYIIADTTKTADYETQAQSKAKGNRLLLADLHPARIINWLCDESELLVCHDLPDHQEVWLWTKTDVTMCPLNEKGEIASMKTIPHGWKSMPIVRLDGLNCSMSLIRDISEMNKRLFRDDSLLSEESEKQIFSQFFLFGISGDDLREQDTVALGSRKYICINKMGGLGGSGVTLERAAGDPAMSQSLRDNITQDIQEIYRMAGLRMPDVLAGPESGRALRIRNVETIAIAERLADNAELGENRLLDLYEQAYGGELEPVVYQKQFEQDDLEVTLKRTLDVITSPEFGPLVKAQQRIEYVQNAFSELDAETLEGLVEESRTFQPVAIPGQEGGPGQAGQPGQGNVAQQFDQAANSMDSLKKSLGDGQPSPELEPEPEEQDEKGVTSGANSGATSSGKARPGELRDAPEGDIRFDTHKVMLDPNRRAAQHKVDDEFVDKLAESFRESGWDPELSDGILAVHMKTGHFATLDGHHRQEAAVRAGLKEIPANALSQDQFTALLQLRFGGGMPRKMSKMDPYIFVNGVSYDNIRDPNKHKGGSSGAATSGNEDEDEDGFYVDGVRQIRNAKKGEKPIEMPEHGHHPKTYV